MYLPLIRTSIKIFTLLVVMFVAVGAGQVFCAALENGSKDEKASLIVNEAEEHIKQGDLPGASMLYDEAIALLGDEAPSTKDLRDKRDLLPIFYDDLERAIIEGEQQRAFVICKRKLAEDRTDFIARTSLGRIYLDRGALKRAIWYFRSALWHNNLYPSARFLLGKVYRLENKPVKALEQMELYLDGFSELPDIGGYAKLVHIARLNYISSIYLDVGNNEKALNILKEAYRIKEDDQQTLYNMGVFYYTKERSLSKAFEFFNKVIAAGDETQLAGMAEYGMDFIRRNPDPRLVADFGFLYER